MCSLLAASSALLQLIGCILVSLIGVRQVVEGQCAYTGKEYSL